MTPHSRSATFSRISCLIALPFTLFLSSAFASNTVITQGPGPLSVTMDEDGSPTAFAPPALDATDGCGSPINWSVSVLASHGTAVVSGTGASPTMFNYTPDTDFHGSDSFTVQASGITTDTIVINVTFNPQNDAPYFEANIGYDGTWGTQGAGDGQFRDVESIAIDSAGNVYTLDWNLRRVQKFTADGTFVTKWGSVGSGDGQFSFSGGIAVDSSDNVYVAGSFNDRIQKFDSSGTFITKWGTEGTGNGELDFPMGMAFDSEDNLYVVEYNNSRVQKFDSNGTYVTKWGVAGSGNGQFNNPFYIAIDASDNVYVTDQDNDRVQKFDSDGNFLLAWGSAGSGPGLFGAIHGITVTPDGIVIVVDKENDELQFFDTSGNFLTRFGVSGTGVGEFDQPLSVAINDTGRLYISQFSRIQYFSTALGGLSPEEARAMFPGMTDAEFDAMDTNQDGFLSEAELGGEGPAGGCLSPDSGGDIFAYGLVLYLLAWADAIQRRLAPMMGWTGTESKETEE